MFSGYRITSEYGPRIHPITGKNSFHSGIDLVRKISDDIPAFVGGEVLYSGWGKSGTGLGGYGNVVFIKDDNGAGHLYAHLDSMAVSSGDTVDKNDIIGVQGKTGNVTGIHLHYEIRPKTSPSFGWPEHVNPGDYLKEYNSKPSFYINGEPADPRRILEDGRTYVHLRQVLDPLEIPVHWENGITYVGKKSSKKGERGDFFINGQKAHPAKIVRDGRTYIHLRDLLEPMGIKIHWENGITYIDSDKKEEYHTWTTQATEWKGLILAQDDPLETYHRIEYSTPFLAPEFDGVNSIFHYVPTNQLLGVAYDRGEIHCKGVNRVPPRDCLIIYRDRTCEILPIQDITEEFDEEGLAEIHLAVGGFSNDPDRRRKERVKPHIRAGSKAMRTFIGYRDDRIIMGCTAEGTGHTLDRLEEKLKEIFPDDTYIHLDGGGSTGAYFHNDDSPVYVRESRKVPALIGFHRR